MPGAGLGRLLYECVRAGYATQGNEFDYFMLTASNVILNMYVYVFPAGELPQSPWHPTQLIPPSPCHSITLSPCHTLSTLGITAYPQPDSPHHCYFVPVERTLLPMLPLLPGLSLQAVGGKGALCDTVSTCKGCART